jgi:hypothetical protein
VALALGIPQTILFANSANYATSQSDQLNFYNTTIVPRCEFISATLNEQVLEPMGYSLEFSPESLDIYQQDESERSQALAQLTGAGVPLLMAMDILGYELTKEQRAELEKAQAEKEKQAEQMQEQLQQKPAQGQEGQEKEEPGEQPPQFQKKALDADATAELKRWRRSCLEQHRKGKPIPADWEAEAIPADYAAAVRARLETATDVEAIKAAFENTTVGPEFGEWIEIDLAQELKRASDLLEKAFEQ